MKSSRFATVDSLTLFAPALDGLWPADAAPDGLLGTAAARGRVTVIRGCFSPASLLGIDPAEVPGAASLTRRIDRPDDADGHWLRADPVRLDADIDAVWFAEHAPPPLPDARRDRIVQAVNDLVADDGLAFDWPHPARAYFRLPEPPEATFTDPRNAVGGRLDDALPEGREADRWRSLFTELQMLLHPLVGPGEANALWLWGAGPEPGTPPATGLAGVAALETELRGLAGWLDLPVREPAPRPGPGAWLTEWTPDPERGRADNLARFNREWLAPAWRDLARGRIRSLVVATETRVLRAGRGDRFAFWRRR